MSRIKLSICMITKNEEANLKRCLDSFLPIIHERWCELVIVDTGSTDRTLQVAKQYTRKLYEEKFIPWNFSKARNYGIEICQGEKIIVIDADEELQQESLYILEDTILNPKRSEPTVFIKVYNIYTKDRKQYSEMLHPRIFQNNNGFHYEGSIHNRPIIKAPYLFCPTVIINHYGYMFQGEKGEKLFEEKKKRGLPMLLEEHKKNPKNLHNLTHLVKTLYVLRDIEKTVEYGELWMKDMRKVEFHEGWWSFLEVFSNLVGAYLILKDLKNAERIEREACRYSNRIPGIYLMLGNYFTGKDNERAKDYFEIALNICNEKGSLYEQLLVNNVKMVLPEILNWLATYSFGEGKYKQAGKFMNDGIIMNKNRLALRWDIFNEQVSSERLINNQELKNYLDILKAE